MKSVQRYSKAHILIQRISALPTHVRSEAEFALRNPKMALTKAFFEGGSLERRDVFGLALMDALRDIKDVRSMMAGVTTGYSLTDLNHVHRNTEVPKAENENTEKQADISRTSPSQSASGEIGNMGVH